MKKFFKKIASIMAIATVGVFMTGCSEEKFTVTFNYGVGSGDSTQSLDSGKRITKPDDPTRAGYIFAGWYKDSEYTIPYDFSQSITEDTTIYAKWIKYGVITVPNIDSVAYGYTITTPEGQGETLIEGETATFYVIVSKDYVNSTVVFKINGVELIATATEELENFKKYTYSYIGNGDDVTMTVEGVKIMSHTVELPNFEGVVVKSASGYDNRQIDKYKEYKFFLQEEVGYDISNVVVKVDGVEIPAVNGIYTISAVVSDDHVITIEGVVKDVYTVSYFENDVLVVGEQGTHIKFYNNPSSVVDGDSISFEVQVTTSKYSQVVPNLADYIIVEVDGIEVDKTVEGNIVTVSGDCVTGNVEVNILSDYFGLNTYVVNLPDTSVEDNGYMIFIEKYKQAESENYVLVQDKSQREIHIPYGSTIYVGLDIHTDLRSLAKEAGVALIIRDKNGVSVINYDLDNATPIEKTINQDTSIEINAYFGITLKNCTGIEYKTVEGYSVSEAKAYLFANDNAEYIAREYKFALQVKDGFDSTNMRVEYYYGDNTINTVTLKDNSGIYSIENISDDVTVVISGVVEEESQVTLPTSIDGFSSILFSDNTTTKSGVKYKDNLSIVMAVDEAYNYYIEDIALDLQGKATIVRSDIDKQNNIITFQLSQVSSDITAQDFVVTGLYKNVYNVALPDTNSRDRYKLCYEDGTDITTNTIVKEYGESLVIKVVKNDAFTKDNDYIVKINGEEFVGLESIELNNIKDNITIEISGIDEYNTYTIRFFQSNGQDVYSEQTLVHGSILTLPYCDEDMGTHYEFAGWYYADVQNNVTNVEAKAGDIVTSDVNIVATKKLIEYSVTYISDIDKINIVEGEITYTIEDIMNGINPIDSIELDETKQTVDYFVLDEDVKIGDTLHTKGEVVSTIDESLVGNIKIRAVWKVTVGSSTTSNYDNLQEAINRANLLDIDKVELVGSVNNITSGITIKKSVNITTQNNRRYTISSTAGQFIGDDYIALFYINGEGESINVIFNNVTLRFNSNNTTRQATTMYVNNANVTINGGGIKSTALGITYNSAGNSLSISDATFEINNPTNWDNYTNLQRTCGIEMDATADTTVEISNTTFTNNASVSGFNAIWIKTNNALVTINIVDSKFNGVLNSENYGHAIVMDGDVEIECSGVEVNYGITGWSHFIIDNNETVISSSYTQDEKHALLHCKDNEIANMLQNNIIKNSTVVQKVYYDEESNENMYYSLNVLEDNNAIAELQFVNISQLRNYVGMNARMKYINISQLSISEGDLVLGRENLEQLIDLNGADLKVLNNGLLTNYCNIINASSIIISAGSSVNNYGSIQCERFVNNGIVEVFENATIEAYTISNTIDANVTNTGSVITQNINNTGVIVNNDILSISQNLNNNANIINNNNAVLKLYSSKITNKGSIANSGTINDNDAGLVVLGLINDYGVDCSQLTMEKYGDSNYIIQGKAIEVDDTALVNTMYPNGTGYYVGLTVFTGIIQSENFSTMEITFTRYDELGQYYDYISKTVTDKVDEMGRLEMIIDINASDYNYLHSINIKVTDNNGIDYTYNLYFSNLL